MGPRCVLIPLALSTLLPLNAEHALCELLRELASGTSCVFLAHHIPELKPVVDEERECSAQTAPDYEVQRVALLNYQRAPYVAAHSLRPKDKQLEMAERGAAIDLQRMGAYSAIPQPKGPDSMRYEQSPPSACMIEP